MNGAPNPGDALDDLKPELANGPLGLPYIKPQGAPELPGSEGDAPNPLPSGDGGMPNPLDDN